QLAAVLKKLPKSFNKMLCNHCFKVTDERFEGFYDDKYLTCFFLDPHFRNTPLKKGAYAKVVKCVMTIGKRLGFDLHESKNLM
ncbi:17251_t:CDS:1, partial [Entrophospora sp. SA101]